jgi:hypothetical protein
MAFVLGLLNRTPLVSLITLLERLNQGFNLMKGMLVLQI